MNARLDLLALPTSNSAAPAPKSALCCERYVAGSDTPPALMAGAVALAERSGEWLFRSVQSALRGAASSRQ